MEPHNNWRALHEGQLASLREPVHVPIPEQQDSLCLYSHLDPVIPSLLDFQPEPQRLYARYTLCDLVYI